VAEAQLRAAEAVLQRARWRVRQEAVPLYRELLDARAEVRAAKQALDMEEELYKKRARSTPEVTAARSRLQNAKDKLAGVEARVSYFQGQEPAEAK
jgi:hypothetical protein